MTSPHTIRLLSVSSRSRLAAILAHTIDPSVNGVAIAAHLLDPSTVRTLQTHHLWIQAWTVNTMTAVNSLARLGIDGVTTDSLPILAALSQNRVGSCPVRIHAGAWVAQFNAAMG